MHCKDTILRTQNNWPYSKLIPNSGLIWLLDVRKCSPATRNYRLAAIHSLCKYLQYAVIDMIEEWQKILSIKAMKTSGNTLNYLTVDGIKLLLAQPDTSTWRGR